MGAGLRALTGRVIFGFQIAADGLYSIRWPDCRYLKKLVLPVTSMPLKKDLFAAEIKDGQEFCSPFLVKTARMADTKQGKPFLTLELMDRSGELVARVLDDAERLSSLCPPGAVLQVTAAALSYKGALQLKVSALERVGEVSPQGLITGHR